jgi:hypothetical protein
MISGVVLVLFGEALMLLSRPHFGWMLIFLGVNAVYIPLEYCRHVPRLLPRWRLWYQAGTHASTTHRDRG